MTRTDRRQAQMDRLKAECDRRADEKGEKSQSEPESFELEPTMMTNFYALIICDEDRGRVRKVLHASQSRQDCLDAMRPKSPKGCYQSIVPYAASGGETKRAIGRFVNRSSVAR
jgi:hypothetical protein